MPQIIVRLRAGRAHRALGEQLRAVVEAAVPVVEAVTRLPLPDPVVVRALTPRRWHFDEWRSARNHLGREITELGYRETGPYLNAAKARMLAAGAAHRKVWVAVGGQSVEYKAGRPEVVLAPEQHRHAGRYGDLPVLHKIIGHELVHLAQHAASRGETWKLQSTRFPELRGTTGRAYHWLVEGHAYWMDQLITTKMLGGPVRTDTVSEQASPLYRSVVTDAVHQEQLRYLDQAAGAVESAVGHLGLDVFNQVWTRPDLVPLDEETETPKLWWERWT
ncbi:hypothetical protein [Streptomyces sp. NPDC001889]